MNKNADIDPIIKGTKLKTKATFEFDILYAKMKYWFEFKGYGDESKNFKEEFYIERNTANGKSYEIKWKGEKTVSDYFSNIIEIEFAIVGLKDIEVTENNKKLKMHQASVEMKFSSSLVRNRQGKWSKDSIIKSIYEKFIIPTRIEQYKIMLYEETYNLINEVKVMLNIAEL